MKITVIPVVVGALETTSKDLENILSDMDISGRIKNI